MNIVDGISIVVLLGGLFVVWLIGAFFYCVLDVIRRAVSGNDND